MTDIWQHDRGLAHFPFPYPAHRLGFSVWLMRPRALNRWFVNYGVRPLVGAPTIYWGKRFFLMIRIMEHLPCNERGRNVNSLGGTAVMLTEFPIQATLPINIFNSDTRKCDEAIGAVTGHRKVDCSNSTRANPGAESLQREPNQQSSDHPWTPHHRASVVVQLRISQQFCTVLY